MSTETTETNEAYPIGMLAGLEQRSHGELGDCIRGEGTLPETNSSPMKNPHFSWFPTIKMADFSSQLCYCSFSEGV